MTLKLLKLNRPVAERQAVWINSDDVTHIQEAADGADWAEVHLRNGAMIRAVESASSIAEALQMGVTEIGEENLPPKEPMPIA
ncbi:hypothetical protein [Brevundimonas sp. GCM10030266]|uniref:hypothetical protein n=1 Tax=Brevundimonas sp. GCM10030266 TaxID=3273386 RepID=UPI00361A313F